MTAQDKRARRQARHQLANEWLRLMKSFHKLGSFSTPAQIRQAAKVMDDRTYRQARENAQ